MSSAIGAARGALFDLLEAAAPVSSTQAPAKVQVTYGPPDAYEDQELLTLAGVETPDEDTAALGNHARDENFVLVVGVKAHDPAGTARSVDARGWVLAEIPRTVVAANRTLGGTVQTAEVASIRHDDRTPDGVAPVIAPGSGYVTFLRVAVRCWARIT